MAKGAYIGVEGVARKMASPFIGVEGVAQTIKSGYIGVDGVARQFLAPEASVPVILEVEKITSNTYANETTYENEEFILLDIYPKTNGTVSVTYGDLTKTITDTSGAEEPNAQQVFFGTFNGVTDSVATPASGTLTIEGDYKTFAVGFMQTTSKEISIASSDCITAVKDFGSVTSISIGAFGNCKKLTGISIPDNVTHIGSSAFSGAENITISELPSGLTYIGDYAFSEVESITISELPSGLTYIGDRAFYTSDTYEASDGSHTDNMSRTSLLFTKLPDSLTYLGSYGCYANDSLVGELVLPDGLTEIGNYAIQSCGNLTKVVIGDNVTSIGTYGIAYCNLMKEIIIGKNVSSIRSFAFYSNANGVKVTIFATTPPDISDGNSEEYLFGLNFEETVSSITVPKGCGETYRTSEQWGVYASKILEAT